MDIILPKNKLPNSKKWKTLKCILMNERSKSGKVCSFLIQLHDIEDYYRESRISMFSRAWEEKQ